MLLVKEEAKNGLDFLCDVMELSVEHRQQARASMLLSDGAKTHLTGGSLRLVRAIPVLQVNDIGGLAEQASLLVTSGKPIPEWLGVPNKLEHTRRWGQWNDHVRAYGELSLECEAVLAKHLVAEMEDLLHESVLSQVIVALAFELAENREIMAGPRLGETHELFISVPI